MADRLKVPLILHICGRTVDRLGYIAQNNMAAFHFDSKNDPAEAMQIADPAYQAWEASLTKLWRLNKVPGPSIAEFIPPTLEEAILRGSVVVGSAQQN